MKQVKIVPMAAEHLDRLEQLERMCFSRPWSRQMLAEELDNQCAAFLVALEPETDKVIGYAGLLDGRRAATHWEFEQDFQRRFPQVQLDINALYVDDQRIITSAGTAAALDCCLYIIRQRFGSLAANQIARRMIVSPHREGGQAQFIAQPVPKNTRDARINCLLDYLQQHIAEPHSLDSLARVVAMSRRTLTRHFARATGMSITDWLTAERLRRSQTLLEAGDLPVEQVAEAVGYLSAVTWRQQFKARFGVSPTEWRRTFRRGA